MKRHSVHKDDYRDVDLSAHFDGLNPLMSRAPRLPLSHHAKNAVNACLVALAMALEPIEYVGIETNRQLFFCWRPRRGCLLQKHLVQRGNVGIVDIGVL